jgi:hypothetical protein
MMIDHHDAEPKGAGVTCPRRIIYNEVSEHAIALFNEATRRIVASPITSN